MNLNIMIGGIHRFPMSFLLFFLSQLNFPLTQTKQEIHFNVTF